MMIEVPANRGPHCPFAKAATPVVGCSDPDVDRPGARFDVAPIVRLFLGGVGELYEADRSAGFFNDEQFAPGHLPHQLGRPVVPIRARSAQRGGHIGVFVPHSEYADVIDPHPPQRDHMATITAALGAVSCGADEGRRNSCGGRSVGVEIGEDDRKVLCVGQQSHDVGMVGTHELEPAHGQALDSHSRRRIA